ncbi:type II toxin-antitoxin system prevent-host-death family antitoxin [Marinactinospora rubrisoli]|uniref:Type II toxin-antitoxin system prevent-host-death family antitoxin n=1 Tax=Marinactinospora rubrisoli TaxID=2715399 RepID=A0ABW2KEI8_9ACTN
MAILRNVHEVSVTEAARRGVAGIVSDAENGAMIVVTRRHEPVAAVVGYARLAELEQAEEDLRDLALVMARAATDTGERIPFEDAMKAFGLTKESLEAHPDEDDRW